MQNTGLRRNEADATRQRDFDELFFFAGASDEDIQQFQKQAVHRKFEVRPRGAFWSIAVNANLASCVRELRKLYDRSFHKPAFSVALGQRIGPRRAVSQLRSSDSVDGSKRW